MRRWANRFQVAVTSSFAYEGLGRRIIRTVGTDTLKYLYDGLDAVLEKDAGNMLVARYLRGLAIDEPW